jgi:two-component system chemotaxis response regulator CheB
VTWAIRAEGEEQQAVNPSSTFSPERLSPHAAFDVVAIAASVGGLQAMRKILTALPADFPAALFIQTHLTPTYPSKLVEVLQPRTLLPVAWATDSAVLRPGTVMVAPPGQHVRVTPSGRLCLTSWADMGYAKPRADGLFTSVAASFQTRALGVVLTGYLDDGARGSLALRQAGGRVLVQDPATAEAPDMPLAALRTGCADFVLPLDTLPAALTALVMVRGMATLLSVPGIARGQPYREALRTWGA